MRWFIITSAAIALFAGKGRAITIADIPDLRANAQLTALADSIAKAVAPIEQNTALPGGSASNRDSVRATLYRIIAAFDVRSFAAHGPAPLIAAMLWHYLSQLGVDSAVAKADSYLSQIEQSNPAYSEASWLKAMNLVRGGRITGGLRLMDSLNTSGSIRSDHFIRDYAGLAVAALLFGAGDSTADTAPRILPRNYFHSLPNHAGEMLPHNVTWRVLSGGGVSDRMPMYALGAIFSLKPEFRLRLPAHDPPYALESGFPSWMSGDVCKPLLFSFDAAPYRTEVRIVVDINKPVSSLSDFLYFIVNNRFDDVAQSPLAHKVHGISLRCYNRSCIRDVPGDYYAFVAFDKPIEGARGKPRPRLAIEPPANSTARYLICMKSRQAVESKADAILEQIVERFQ